MRGDAAELIGLVPDVILTTSNQSASILGRQTRTIPIVFAPAGDPVGPAWLRINSDQGQSLLAVAGSLWRSASWISQARHFNCGRPAATISNLLGLFTKN
jgi:hypothetical protein